MRLGGAARLFAQHTVWRLTGLRPVGRAIIRALGSDDEDLRTMAGMMLVRSGHRATPLLHEALASRQNLPMLLTIVGDIGDATFVADLARFSGDEDPQVACAAQDALRLLDAKHSGRQAPDASP